MSQFSQELAASIAEGSKTAKYIFIERAWDATPLEVEFGILEPLLFDSARYRLPGHDGPGPLVSYTEAMLNRLRTKKGGFVGSETVEFGCGSFGPPGPSSRSSAPRSPRIGFESSR